MNTEGRKSPPKQSNSAERKDRTEPEGSIPNETDGVGLTSGDEPNTFEEEEDPGQGPEDAGRKRSDSSDSSDEENDGG